MRQKWARTWYLWVTPIGIILGRVYLGFHPLDLVDVSLYLVALWCLTRPEAVEYFDGKPKHASNTPPKDELPRGNARADNISHMEAPIPAVPTVAVARHGGSLVVKNGLNAGTHFKLNAGVTSIGRSETNDIVLDDPAASRRHASIYRQAGEYILEDVGSTGGMLLDGKRVVRQRLTSGSTIRMGKTELMFL